MTASTTGSAPTIPTPALNTCRLPLTGSATASDGTTINWKTAADGSVTFSSPSYTRQLVRRPRISPAVNTLWFQTVVYTAPGMVEMTCDSVVDFNLMLVRRRWCGSKVLLRLDAAIPSTASSTAPVNLTLSGQVDTRTINWKGAAAPGTFVDPTKLAGWPANVLVNGFGLANYFAPAFATAASRTSAKNSGGAATSGSSSSSSGTKKPVPVPLAETKVEPTWWLPKAFGLAEVVCESFEGPEKLFCEFDVEIMDQDLEELQDKLPPDETENDGYFTLEPGVDFTAAPSPGPPPATTIGDGISMNMLGDDYADNTPEDGPLIAATWSSDTPDDPTTPGNTEDPTSPPGTTDPTDPQDPGSASPDDPGSTDPQGDGGGGFTDGTTDGDSNAFPSGGTGKRGKLRNV